VREWNRVEVLKGWREAWATHVNTRLAELGIEQRIDHRTLRDQGIELEPQHKIGPAGARREERGEAAERAADHRRIARENGDKAIADPALLLAAVTRNQATFTTRELAVFAHRHSDGAEQFDRVMGAVKASPELVKLGKDVRGDERFTSREMVEVEVRLEQASDRLALLRDHGGVAGHRETALAAAQARGLTLSREQHDAFWRVTRADGLSLVIGFAGSGKSAMLGVAREAWEKAGFNVRGAALSGIAAETLEAGSGIVSRTIASLEHGWGKGFEGLTRRDVLVIDEAGMVGTRQMERVLTAAKDASAKVVLIGDPEQLQAIEAGAAFRMLAERHGAAEITEIRRQREPWQQDATRSLAFARAADALNAYHQHGMVHAAPTREEARSALIDRWDAQCRAEPDKSRIILTHTNAERLELNAQARGRMRMSGELGADVAVRTEHGERPFATGDRLMFLRNDRELGVKNGTLGRIERVSPDRMRARLDDGRRVAFDLKHYAHLDHGYAATYHKAQGVTVDRTHVLATPGMDRHAAYTGLSRHRDGVELHWGRDDFKNEGALTRALSRDRSKDMAGDHQPARDEMQMIHAFADRRGITIPERFVAAISAGKAKAVDVARDVRDRFSHLRLSTALLSSRPGAAKTPAAPGRAARSPAPSTRTPARSEESMAVERYAQAHQAIGAMVARNQEALPHQKIELEKAGDALDQVRPDGAQDLAAAFERGPELVGQAAKGSTGAAQMAMDLETRVRADPELRADRFAEAWSKLRTQHDRTDGYGAVADRAMTGMEAMAASAQKDPELVRALDARVDRLAGSEVPRGRPALDVMREVMAARDRDMDMER
jgi:Ti-type conjugative transfer relaxase TraA